MWLSRDKEGVLFMSAEKPIRIPKEGYFEIASVDKNGEAHYVKNKGRLCMFGLNSDWVKINENDDFKFPEVTWENSPIELILKPK